MEQQHYVYGVYHDVDQVSRAVSALTNASFEVSDIDAFTVRMGKLQRLPMVHRRPMWMGAVIGAVIGAVLGIGFGLTWADEWFPGHGGTLTWAFFGLLAGGFIGTIGGSVFWFNVVGVSKRNQHMPRYYVGTTVPPGRAAEAHEALEQAAPAKQGEYPIGADETLELHASRDMLMEP